MRFSKSAAYHCSRARTPLMSRSNLGNWSERGSIAASCDASSKRAVSEFTTSSKHAWNPSQAFGHSRIRSYKIYLLNPERPNRRKSALETFVEAGSFVIGNILIIGDFDVSEGGI